MHVSYISLAFFAVGAIAAPAAPKPDEFGDITSGFPFNTVGSSSIEDSDEGFDDSFPSALDAMHQALAQKQQSAQSVQFASTSHPLMAKPTKAHPTANFPAPIVSQAPTLSQAAPAISQAPVISKAEPTHALPATSHAVIPTPAKSSSASPSSSATPSPSAPAGPLSGLVGGLPLVGGMVGGPLAGLGLRR
ncbi:hypothetical protein N7489_001226 [Penicillium chrysogenum]|jgi:hypothetical protein|uniref:Uncharacterized protein n=1 Tax=Penicillium chrysogenum TaxID=5076 RepID=A0ABQ8WJD3_PENCH|nr:uncharacterized protein N7489_001226 [Penicillium chrysogenum]KAJ5250816.1 hypothetical protein N7489_001226 [Penicillium chrysogenum]KAJ5262250.1 hypothetical protein N7524_007555 [Penicillium chrysogenum]KAJ5269715.1 hypothetical protein N7505_005473 [Penicillium chrysogenum]KAJ6147556.1 hypothetical protein N7497_009538 [Penicillium chrysogenum]